MRRRLAAFGVHVLTASGAVLSFLALMEVIAHRWEAAFAWLGLALLVDGVDGPLARWVGATEALPRFSGEHLDIVIDYLTYVFVPAFIVYEAKLVPSDLALTAVAIILLTSLFHFTDQRSKAADGFFIGFPALWNIVAFYFVIFQIPPGTSFILLVLFAVLTFFPLKWIHPIRVRRFRPITLSVMTIWTGATLAALTEGFPSSPGIQIVIALSTLYLLAIGLLRSIGATTETNAQAE